ncbi:MAG: CBS domain-containing protein [Ignavibacteria bacterium]|nr:CBS domain-containing protein [Ignavibacteria bacterium]
MKSISEIVQDRPLYAASPEMSVEDAARQMAENKIGAVPVVSENRLVGIFSERDVVTRVIARGLDPKKTIIKEVMTTKIVVAQSDETYDSCLTKMQKAHCRHLPVVSGDKLIGMVSLRDLLQIDLDEKERSLEYLESYIYTIPPGAAKRYKQE